MQPRGGALFRVKQQAILLSLDYTIALAEGFMSRRGMGVTYLGVTRLFFLLLPN